MIRACMPREEEEEKRKKEKAGREHTYIRRTY
jgi:hypothetical protein